jgi:hypothetical protein
MARLGDGVAEDFVHVLAGQAQETGQHGIGRGFAPLAQQMEHEKKGVGGRPLDVVAGMNAGAISSRRSDAIARAARGNPLLEVS